MQLRIHAKVGNNRSVGGNKGAATMLKAWWLIYPCSSVSALFPMFSVCICRLCLALRLHPSLSTGFSFSPSPLFCFPRLTIMQGWRKKTPFVLFVFFLSFPFLFFLLFLYFFPSLPSSPAGLTSFDRRKFMSMFSSRASSLCAVDLQRFFSSSPLFFSLFSSLLLGQ